MKETDENLRAQVTGVCRGYCLQVWNEALNQAGVDAFSTLKRAENVYYPLALCVAGPSISQVDTAPKAPEPSKAAPASALPAPTVPSKEADQAGAMDKDNELTKDKVPKKELAKEPVKDSSKEKGAS